MGKLDSIAKWTRPEKAYAPHQCANFQRLQRQSVKNPDRETDWLTKMKTYPMSKPQEELLMCFVDAWFTGSWLEETAQFESTSR
jgi:hypothetical protein